MKTKFVTLLVVTCAIICGWLFWKPDSRQALVALPSGSSAAQKPNGKTALTQVDAASSSSRKIAVTVKARVLNSREFNDRFLLSDLESIKLRKAVFAIGYDMLERKGLGARIQSYNGNTLKLEIPALEMSDDDIKTAISGHLAAAIGEEKATAIWEDPDGRKTLMALAGMGHMSSDALYTFQKVREENNPSTQGSLGYATFDVEWNNDSIINGNNEQPKRLFKQKYLGFTFADTYNIALGWNAMSKAPAGYFRSEPIDGVASRPEAELMIIRDRKSGDVELLNARHPGSQDKFPGTPRT